jgi:hypothetical protein
MPNFRPQNAEKCDLKRPEITEEISAIHSSDTTT